LRLNGCNGVTVLHSLSRKRKGPVI
jgi:hypothetical protein